MLDNTEHVLFLNNKYYSFVLMFVNSWLCYQIKCCIVTDKTDLANKRTDYLKLPVMEQGFMFYLIDQKSDFNLFN